MGNFSTVYLVRERESNSCYAAKILDTSQLTPKLF